MAVCAHRSMQEDRMVCPKAKAIMPKTNQQLSANTADPKKLCREEAAKKDRKTSASIPSTMWFSIWSARMHPRAKMSGWQNVAKDAKGSSCKAQVSLIYLDSNNEVFGKQLHFFVVK